MNGVIYLHGMGGSAREAERFKPLFPDCEVVGFDYRAAAPWEAESGFSAFARDFSAAHDRVVLIANSIGAYYAICARLDLFADRAYFISPVVDMEGLIAGRMREAGVTEERLKTQRVIRTPSGELSYAYLSYVKTHPVVWSAPTEILWGGGDRLVPRADVTAFAAAHGARLTVMEDGEHWFHTEAQLRFLDEWILRAEKA